MEEKDSGQGKYETAKLTIGYGFKKKATRAHFLFHSALGEVRVPNSYMILYESHSMQTHSNSWVISMHRIHPITFVTVLFVVANLHGIYERVKLWDPLTDRVPLLYWLQKAGETKPEKQWQWMPLPYPGVEGMEAFKCTYILIIQQFSCFAPLAHFCILEHNQLITNCQKQKSEWMH